MLLSSHLGRQARRKTVRPGQHVFIFLHSKYCVGRHVAKLQFPELLPDEDLRLAHRLLGTRNTLDRDVLLALVGKPRSFGDLRPLLGKKRDHNLTMSLHRLRRDGLTRQRVAYGRGAVTEHELSTQGIRVVALVYQLRPLAESAAMLRRAESYAHPA